MSKVDIYVENIFAGLPHTRQAAAEKAALLQQMQQRYDALLSGGKTEQEALGIVVAENDNFEPLRHKLGLKIVVAENDNFEPLRHKLGLKKGDAAKESLQAEYASFTKRFAVGISTGVALCLLGASSLIVFSITQLLPKDSSIPGLLFLVLLISGVTLCVYFGMKNGHYLERMQAAGCEPGTLNRKRRKQMYDRISSSIMAIAVLAFICFLLAGMWHPGWVALPIGGILCAVVWQVLGMGQHSDSESDKDNER